MQKKQLIILAIILAIVIAGGSFYGGMLYGNSKSASTSAAARSGFAGRTGRGGTAGAGFTSGTIIAEDSSSITLELPTAAGGGSKIIFYSSVTPIGKMTSGTPSDLKNGINVSVTGTTNSDGSITAQSIQLRPATQAPASGQ